MKEAVVPSGIYERGRNLNLVKAMKIVALLIVSLLGSAFLSSCAEPPKKESPKTESLPPEPTTPPLEFDGFNASHIIDDAVFYDNTTMDETSVAEFLNKWGEGCRPGYDFEKGEPIPCLKDVRVKSVDQPAGAFCKKPYRGGENETAAAVIYKVAQACGINPQVILVTLQKEQGLITASSSSLKPYSYLTAMGYGCPDTAQCKPEFIGFFKQVYFAASQFQRYRATPGKFNVKAGKTTTIKHGPQEGCGESPLQVDNVATANLYNYTPHQPSKDTLENGFGECQDYGNMNFYAYFKAWFGSPVK